MDGVKRFSAKVEHEAKAKLGEGPVWSAREGLLYWTDINGCAVHSWDPIARTDSAVSTAPHRVGAFARCAGRDPILLCAAEHGMFLMDLTRGRDPSPKWVVRDAVGPKSESPVRFNDGKCDPAGRFIAGTMTEAPREQRKPTARVYTARQGNTGAWECDEVKEIGGVTTSNGLAWTADGKTLYYIDTPARRIVRFGYNVPSGAVVGPASVVAEVPEWTQGGFDGMTIDSEGMLWVALYRGGCVVRFDVSVTPARIVAVVDVPAKLTTSCCFGGADLKTLFITSAANAEDAGNPLAGSLFSVDVGVNGVPMNEFNLVNQA